MSDNFNLLSNSTSALLQFWIWSDVKPMSFLVIHTSNLSDQSELVITSAS